MRQPDRIIRFDTVRARTGLSRSTITALDGGNLTSTAGLPIPPGGGSVCATSSTSSMTIDRRDDDKPEVASPIPARQTPAHGIGAA